MSSPAVSYLVFDIESIVDGDLVSKIRYPGDGYSPKEAIEAYCAERMKKFDTEFIPYTFHIPISVAIIKLAVDFRIIDIVVLDEPEYRPHVITKHFWDGWRIYNTPTFVTFNGRTFDIPLMELSAFRYGISAPNWFNSRGKPSYEQKRNRFNQSSHVDLQEILTNYGATRFNGGLNLAANLLGKPGKMGVKGDMVQELYDAGEMGKINDYCRCDVLDTYFVLLRTKVLTGELELETEIQLVEEAKQWLEDRADELPVYQEYLQSISDWKNPWVDEAQPAAD